MHYLPLRRPSLTDFSKELPSLLLPSCLLSTGPSSLWASRLCVVKSDGLPLFSSSLTLGSIRTVAVPLHSPTVPSWLPWFHVFLAVLSPHHLLLLQATCQGTCLNPLENVRVPQGSIPSPLFFRPTFSGDTVRGPGPCNGPHSQRSRSSSPELSEHLTLMPNCWLTALLAPLRAKRNARVPSLAISHLPVPPAYQTGPPSSQVLRLKIWKLFLILALSLLSTSNQSLKRINRPPNYFSNPTTPKPHPNGCHVTLSPFTFL